ncbi:MAG: alpha/beta hydrolase [Actinomycetota bacterium]
MVTGNGTAHHGLNGAAPSPGDHTITGTLASNGIELSYTIDGPRDGEPLVMIMGLGGQLCDWPQGLVDRLAAAGFRVIRFDNRDAGLSTATDTPPPSMAASARVAVVRRGATASYTLADLAGDTVGLLDGLGVERAHIVGMSMGGMIAQEFTIRFPERVRSLTSIMSNTGDRRHGLPASRQLVRLLALLRTTPEAVDAPETLTAAAELVAGTDWDRAAAEQRLRRSVARSYRPDGTAHQAAAIAVSPDRTERLGAVAVPTLVVHGLDDTLVSPSGGVATARAVRGSRLLMFPGMGHDLPATRWDELTEAITTNAGRAEPLSVDEPAVDLVGPVQLTVT